MPQGKLWPGLAIAIAVLAFNLVGEGLNDAMLPVSQENRTVKEEEETGE